MTDFVYDKKGSVNYMVKKYRKKPIVVEAVQWLGNNFKEIQRFAGAKCIGFFKDELEVFSTHGLIGAHLGDYIIKGIKGEFYPCKPDIFAATYEDENSSATRHFQGLETDATQWADKHREIALTLHSRLCHWVKHWLFFKTEKIAYRERVLNNDTLDELCDLVDLDFDTLSVSNKNLLLKESEKIMNIVCSNKTDSEEAACK